MTLLFIYLCFLEEKEGISRFFHSVAKPGVWSFAACRIQALCCLCPVLPLPGSLHWHTWPCRAPLLSSPETKACWGSLLHRGEPEAKPALKAAPLSWITCTWVEIPEPVPVPGNWALPSLGTLPLVFRGACFLGAMSTFGFGLRMS